MRRVGLVVVLVAVVRLGFPPLTAGATEPLFEEVWRTGALGVGVGLTRFAVADVDGDDALEIIASGRAAQPPWYDYWYVLEHDALTGEYEMSWLSDPELAGISTIATFDTDNNGIHEILIGLEDGDVRVFDGGTLALLRTIETPAQELNRILYADADNDGAGELVLCDDTHTYLYSAATGALDQQIAHGASDLAVGNVDLDASLEIVLANGVVLQQNGAATTLEWTYPGGDFGYRVVLADLDDDAMEEIVGAWSYLTVFDADVQSPKWQIPTPSGVGALLATDVTGDEVAEIVVGDAQWGAIRCIDATTRAELWSIANPLHGVSDIVIGDLDGDESPEVLWGAGISSSGPDRLFVHDAGTQDFEWQSRHLDGPFDALAIGDVDDDHRGEIVIASSRSDNGYADGVVRVYDAETQELEWETPAQVFSGHAWTGIHDLALGDPDDDGHNELLVATDKLYNGAVYVLGGGQPDIEASYLLDLGAPIHSLAVADVDGDDESEIVAGGGREHTGAPGVYVYVLDGGDGTVEWKSISLGSYWSSIRQLAVANVDTDPALEIVAINDSAFVIDGETHVQWQSTTGGFEGLDLFDVTGDGRPEIVTGTSDGQLVAIDGETHAEAWRHDVSDEPVVGVSAFQGVDGTRRVAFSSAGRVEVFDLSSLSVEWSSPLVGEPAGRNDGLETADADGDLHIDLVVGASYAVHRFRGPAIALPVFIDDFESGHACNWSSIVGAPGCS